MLAALDMWLAPMTFPLLEPALILDALPELSLVGIPLLTAVDETEVLKLGIPPPID
jgi:hypothetical protein